MSEKVSVNQIKSVTISKPTAPVKPVPRLQKSKVKSPVFTNRAELAVPCRRMGRKAFLKSCLNWLICTIIYGVAIFACMFLCDYVMPILFVPVLIIGCIVKFIKVDWKLLVAQCHRLNDAGFNGVGVMVGVWILDSLLILLANFNYMPALATQILGATLVIVYVILLFLPSRNQNPPRKV